MWRDIHIPVIFGKINFRHCIFRINVLRLLVLVLDRKTNVHKEKTHRSP